jgi:hypothetical protein
MYSSVAQNVQPSDGSTASMVWPPQREYVFVCDRREPARIAQ